MKKGRDMLKKLPILLLMNCLLVLCPLYILAKIVNNNHLCIIYSPDEMREYRRKCMAQMSSNQQNLKDPTYQMQRALKTVAGDDTDYIPKVIGAGEIFYNEGTPPYQLMHNGLKVHLNSYYDSQWLTDVIYGLKGHHEPQEEKCFYEVLKCIPKNATIIELGSYWGYYSLWFLSEIKNAKAYLIEPDVQRLEIGKRNFELNNKVGFFKRGFAGIMLDGYPETSGEYISIDDFIESQAIERVNILHADIQGAEYAMLTSIIKHLDKIDYFFISTHEPLVSQRELIKFFETHGCIILAEHNCPESASGDGLIVAKRKGVAGPEKIAIRKYS